MKNFRRVPFLIVLTLWVGVSAALWGVAYAVNGATQAGAEVSVPVIRTVEVVLPSSAQLVGADLLAWDSTVLEQLLARGDVALMGLCAGFGAVLLFQLMSSIVAGEPFRQGNQWWISGLAGAVAVAGIAGVLPGFAAAMVIDRLDLSPALQPAGEISWWLVLVALALLGVAQTFRRAMVSASL